MEIATEATGAHTKGELQADMISRTGFLLCSHCLEDEASPWLVHSHSEDNWHLKYKNLYVEEKIQRNL